MRRSHFVLAALVALATNFGLHAAARHRYLAGGPGWEQVGHRGFGPGRWGFGGPGHWGCSPAAGRLAPGPAAAPLVPPAASRPAVPVDTAGASTR